MVDDDPAETPPPDVPPPSSERPSVEEKEAAPLSKSSSDHGRRPLWDMAKASFIIQVLGLVVAVIGVAVAVVFGLDALSSGSASKSSTAALAVRSTTTSEQPTPERYMSPEATCDEYVDAAASEEGQRLLVGSPGQFSGGPAVELRLLPAGEYTRVASAIPGDVFNVSTQIGNTQYGSLAPVSVRASISSDRGRCWRIIVSAKEPTVGETEWEPVLILLQHGGPTKLEYVPGSTDLEEESGQAIGGGLPDGLLGRWIRLPYEIPGGTTYFLNFEVRIGRGKNARTS